MSDTPNTGAAGIDELRTRIRTVAQNAVIHGGVNRDWVNQQLARMGIDPIITSQGNRYRISVPITGAYGTTVYASTRAEALEKFGQFASQVVASGELRSGSHGQGIFNLAFNPAAGGPQFYSGPEDVKVTPIEDPEELKAAFRAMLMDGVSGHGWSIWYAKATAESLGIPLPPSSVQTVRVPVGGYASMEVTVFDGADPQDVQAAVVALMAEKTPGSVNVKPEEVGEAIWERPGFDEGSAGFNLVDDDEVG